MVLISGHNELVKQRSLLCSMEGFKTIVINSSFNVDKIGYYWGILKRKFSEDLVNSIKGMKFIINKTGVIFDVETKYAEEIENYMKL